MKEALCFWGSRVFRLPLCLLDASRCRETRASRLLIFFNTCYSHNSWNMAVLKFSITPNATSRIYEALTCLAKFGESVSIEARSEKASVALLHMTNA